MAQYEHWMPSGQTPTSRQSNDIDGVTLFVWRETERYSEMRWLPGSVISDLCAFGLAKSVLHEVTGSTKVQVTYRRAGSESVVSTVRIRHSQSHHGAVA